MKFGALLRTSAQEVPDLRGLFLCYKQLKKRLKMLPGRSGESVVNLQGDLREHERAFVTLLISDIQAFNETFVEREEQSVIQLSLIEEKAATAVEAEDVATGFKSFVDFHGQTLMLVHWSILAYTSVLKILKKHHKRTGLQIQEFNMRQLLSQPFCSVELISSLVRRADEKAQELAAKLRMGPYSVAPSTKSPHSSPVAELISVARASVERIAQTAAEGIEALDAHLSEQATSSEEALTEAGEAEVVSLPAKAKDGLDNEPISRQKANETASSIPLAGCKRGREEALQKLSEQQQKRQKGEDIADVITPSVTHRLPALRRTGSVAGDSEVVTVAEHTSEGQVELNGHSIADHTLLQNENSGNAYGNCLHEAGSAASNIANTALSAPQLTVGQAWGWGNSQNILRQTQMALGLWEQLHITASTPSTVVPPLGPSKQARDSANSAA